VGPNGSGKTTLMNLMTGVDSPTQGRNQSAGHLARTPRAALQSLVGYCAQFDACPKGLTGYQFIYWFLRMHGFTPAECDARPPRAGTRQHDRGGRRPVGAYSKGMRQRVKLAQAIAHDPQVLVLDEPLNGLDPMARAETIALFREWGQNGATSSFRATSCMKWTRFPTR
jgi:ABC-2 type transport system ATP-binding protein